MPTLKPVAPRSDTPPLDASAGVTDDEAKAMARAVVRLFERWELSDAQAVVLLGEMSPRTWARWKQGEIGRLSRDLKTRLSNLMGIHKALRIIFADASQGYAWVQRENLAFEGRSALDIMLEGEITDLMRVRRYLDSERGM